MEVDFSVVGGFHFGGCCRYSKAGCCEGWGWGWAEVLKLVVDGCLVVVFLGKVLRSELVNCGPATMSSIGSIVPFAVCRFGLLFLSSSLSSSLSFILLSALFQLFIDYFIQYGNPIQLMFDDAISAPLSRSGAFIV